MHYDKQMLADYNKGRVIELISNNGPINRAEIAKQLDLSIPTIMKIVDEFIHEGIVRTVGRGKSTGGKRPELYEIIKDAYYCIGVDLGRFRLKTIVADLQGEIIVKKVNDISQISDSQRVLEIIEKNIQEIIDNNAFPQEKIMGIGLGVPGIIERETGKILYSPDFGWENVDFSTYLKEKFNLWVAIENSNRTEALGEKWLGVAQPANNIFSVNIGHGIGGAILKGDEIYRGSSGASGEFGHIVLEKDGPLCDCGNHGCLEALASGNAIAKKMKKKEAKEVFDLAREGNREAIEIIDEAVEYLGIGIAGAINVLDPDMVILSGGVTQSYDLFGDRLQQVVKKRQMKYREGKVNIKVGTLGDDATAIGAVVLLLKNFKNHGGQIV
jgi:predicted NBD/HSP70 family sugar kinase